MIDVHSHVIPFVDDGSGSLERSLTLLETAEKDGVTDIVCTPHYRRSSFETDKATIKENFELLRLHNTTKINLYLGQEIAYNPSVFRKIDSGELLTYNGSKYILLEFHYVDYVDISGVAFECRIRGLTPVIAHVERYEYLTADDVEEIRESGALIQMNASSLMRGSHYRSVAKKYLKRDLVDFIASDIHVGRNYCMSKAYEFVKKKYGAERAENLFRENAKVLISG